MPEQDSCVDAILKFNAGGDPERLAIKYKVMRTDPFVFFRGTCHLYYARLPDPGDLAKVPAAWNCGDLHLENFGSYKADNGLVYFDLNDFDEALLAPCIWDLVRVVSSIRMARKSMGLKRKETDTLCADFIATYGDTLAGGKAYWVERETATGIIGSLLSSLQGKSRREQLAGRTKLKGKSHRLLVDGIHALKLGSKSAEQVAKQIAAFLKNNPTAQAFKVLDIARRIAGTGSLGIERYVILAEDKISSKKETPNKMQTLRLVDLKAARPSSSSQIAGIAQPEFGSEAERVVAVQKMMQAVSPAGLSCLGDAEKSYILRALQPREDRLDMRSVASDAKGLRSALMMMARLLAWAQLRSSGQKGSSTADDLMKFGRGGKWQAQVLQMATEAAAISEKDWASYCNAYDAGAFNP